MKYQQTLALIISCLAINACSSDSSVPDPVSINASNAGTFAKLGYQQFIALHSNEMLMRNTIVNQPLFSNPCTAGTYTANFTDANNNTAFDTGDTVVETYDKCALDKGGITVSGVSTSVVTGRTTGGEPTFSLDITHSKLRVSINGNNYTYSGLIKARVQADTVVVDMTNNYRNYRVGFSGKSTTISSGRTIASYNLNERSFNINQGVVFTGDGFSGLLRTDTTAAVIGITTPEGKSLLSGNPLLDPIAEDNAIAAEVAKKTTAGNEEAQRLRDARAAFRSFTGRLIIESVTDNHSIKLNSEDDDDDITTYQRDVRANAATTSKTGLKWVDLLM